MNVRGKVITDAAGLAALAGRLRSGRVVLCQGHYNVIHPGHLRFLEHARSLGEVLVVGLIADRVLRQSEASRHLFSQDERADALAAQADVDHVLILDEFDLKQVIAALHPAVFVLGKEFEEEFADRVAVEVAQARESGSAVVYHSGQTIYAQDDLGGRSADQQEQERRSSFRASCQRQGVDLAAALAATAGFAERRLVVLGDTIVDQYVACDALGMSAEAPVIALKELRSREYIGAAAIVACHIRALGASCDFVSVTGDDEPGRLTGRTLAERGVEAHLFTDPARPTTFKIRYMVGNQKLLRVSRLEETSIPREVEKAVIGRLQELIPHANGVVVSDFVYGLVTPRILDAVQSLARKAGVPIFGDLQCSSQVGSVLKFKHFTLISPNEREARIALGDKDSGLEKVAYKLLARTDCAGLLLTLGGQGFVAYDNRGAAVRSESFPALDPNPVDVTGGGDALLSAVAVAMSSGWGLMQASALGTCVAALAVGRLGNIPITGPEVREFGQRLLDGR